MFLLSFDSDEDKVFEALDISDDVHQALKDNIARRLTPKAVKIRSDIEVKCFSYEGIDAIKAALRAGEAVSTTSVPIKIRLVAPPLYVVSSNSTDKVGGVDLMEKALVEIERVISAAGGEMSVKMKVSREPCCALLLYCPATDSRSPSFSPLCTAKSRFRAGGPGAGCPHGQGRAGERRGVGRRGRKRRRRVKKQRRNAKPLPLLALDPILHGCMNLILSAPRCLRKASSENLLARAVCVPVTHRRARRSRHPSLAAALQPLPRSSHPKSYSSAGVARSPFMTQAHL